MFRLRGQLIPRLTTGTIALSVLLGGLTACGSNEQPPKSPPQQSLAELAATNPCAPRLAKKVRQLVFEFEQQRNVSSDQKRRQLARNPAGRPVVVTPARPIRACQFPLTVYGAQTPSWQITTFSYNPSKSEPPALHRAAGNFVPEPLVVQLLPTTPKQSKWRSWLSDDVYMLGPVESRKPAALAVVIQEREGTGEGKEDMGKYLASRLNRPQPPKGGA